MTSNLDQFIETIARLRAPDGCPWDREQTHLSLARYLLEEAYEVLEAIHDEDSDKLKEELGDLLLQIALNSQIAKEDGHFDIQDVAEGINKKMIGRHPHVFGDGKLESATQVVAQWDELKAKEKKEKNQSGSLLSDIPKTLPALLKALKISEKACGVGFEWESIDGVWDKLYSELVELRDAIEKKSNENRDIDLEIGDVLFTVVNLARWQNLNPEESLLLACEKFKLRFEKMEALAQKPLKELSFSEWDSLWNQAKELCT